MDLGIVTKAHVPDLLEICKEGSYPKRCIELLAEKRQSKAKTVIYETLNNMQEQGLLSRDAGVYTTTEKGNKILKLIKKIERLE